MALSPSLAVSLLLALVTMLGQPVSGNDADDPVAYVSGGLSGRWVTTRRGIVKYRNETYGRPRKQGTGWTTIPGPQLRVLHVSNDVVWGINFENKAFYRAGISKSNPTGTKWVKVKGEWKHISVSPKRYVWGTTLYEKIYTRAGSTEKNTSYGGQGWRRVYGRMKQVSVGHAGVWALDRFQDVFYRNGTYGDNGSTGFRWEKVEGSFVNIYSGTNVRAINRHSDQYVREGANATHPTGGSWRKEGRNRGMFINEIF